MERGYLEINSAGVSYSFLKDSRNRWMEFYYSIVPTKAARIAEQIGTIEQAEKEVFRSLGIEERSVAIKRMFSSDLINHQSDILAYKKRCSEDFFFSLTEQPPVSSAKVALLGMCLSNIEEKFRDENIFYFDTTSGIKHIFAERIVDPDQDADSEKQTRNIFEYLESKLAGFNTSIADGVQGRTWIYAPHVDADYPGIVKARRELFNEINLTKDTHYIASTGIQGGSGERFARVSMDAYAVTGIEKKQIRYIQAPEHLGPTHMYGVTFERATAVELGNTDFLFVSGTASIDKEGEIVHPGDVVRQTERTLENISALLDSAGFQEEDLSSFIVYLRDPTDHEFVRPLIEQYSENLPAIYVKAPVCRPGWLIEIEATAGKCLDQGEKV